MRALMILALSGSLSGVGMASAQTAAQQAACKADYQKFCSGVMPGGGRIIKCLNEHIDQLTAQCQQVVKENTPK
ncbi:MAG: cysteine rich repeat-containing protein [Rhizobiaceae bacterium]|nr:cysteine rich repeat-containing protein [Rhizobiaceae bacterium]